MPLTCSCKQCGREVRPGEICPVCGGKLNPAQAHLLWKTERLPVADWMCWNAIMRIILPVFAAVLVVTLGAEAVSGGAAGVEQLIRGGLLTNMALLLAGVCAAVGLILLMQGREVLVCTVDNRGVHVARHLPEPTPLKLLLRLRSPASGKGKVTVMLDQQDLPWKNIARVQLWQEKDLVLFYAPTWWQRLALPCTPFTWVDTLDMIRQKLGRKKQVRLPHHLREESAPKPREPEAVHTDRHPAPFGGTEPLQNNKK